MKKTVLSKDAPAPIGPYSQAVIHGNLIYVSGQIAIDQTSGELLTADIVSETDQVMKNLQLILLQAGSDFDQVIKCSIFVKNMEDFSKMNETYGQYFPENPPARETAEVSRLPKDVNVEISCIAYL